VYYWDRAHPGKEQSMKPTMTSKQRLLAAIRHEEPDRVPISPRIWAWLIEYYGSCTWDDHLRLQEEMGFDPYMAWATPTGNFMSPSAGFVPANRAVKVTYVREPYQEGHIIRRSFDTPAGPLSEEVYYPPAGREYGVTPTPVHHEHLLKEPADLDRLAYVIPAPESYDLSGYHALAERVGERGIVEIAVTPPLDHFLGDMRGLAQLMEDYYLDRSFFDRMWSFACDYARRMLTSFCEKGAVNVFGSWYFASMSAGWSPALFHQLFTPVLREHAAIVHRYGGIYHAYDDGKMKKTLSEFVDAGVDVVETLTPPPVGDVDLREAKRLYGERICLKGYIDLLYVVKMGTPEDVERAVRETLEIGMPGSGFILGSSDSFRDGTPVENIRAYFRTALKHGQYK
jgi:uroporphyrinogen decarboxylase